MAQKIILEYNRRIYHLNPEDISDLMGSGKITITRRRTADGRLWEQTTEGFSNVKCFQDETSSYVNGVHIESLIKGRFEAEE